MLSPDGTVAEPVVAGADEADAADDDELPAGVVELDEVDELQAAAAKATIAATIATDPDRR